ncbi:hypothetical protein [Mesorhizobium sp. WSM4906]|uniref:hypothetical protein n=1 Tax=Mesorhizobium sp. WSM4906 TaxID=3038546 RepID=UPI0024170FCC|nr:hypothetical protein [Mesorhizobium sp. WSM4906]WFP75461.1 hypothetical protein QAZ22_27730 [Mesorhizobium sp. WSM4906]
MATPRKLAILGFPRRSARASNSLLADWTQPGGGDFVMAISSMWWHTMKFFHTNKAEAALIAAPFTGLAWPASEWVGDEA